MADTQAPDIECPSDMVTSLNRVFWNQPQDVDCTPPSGAFFQPGVTSVQCTATDVAGNSAMCSFSVTVGK